MCVVGDLNEDGNISHMFSSQMRGPTVSFWKESTFFSLSGEVQPLEKQSRLQIVLKTM